MNIKCFFGFHDVRRYVNKPIHILGLRCQRCDEFFVFNRYAYGVCHTDEEFERRLKNLKLYLEHN